MTEHVYARGYGARGMGVSKSPGYSIILLAVLLSAAFWVIDINIDLYVFGEEGTFLSQLLSPELFEVYFRVIVVSLILGLGVVGQISVSRARASELVVRQSEKKFRAITEMAADAIVLANSDDEVVFWNPAAERMFGFNAGEMAGRKFHNLIAQDVDIAAKDGKLGEFGTTGYSPVAGKTHRLTAQKKDGSAFAIDLSESSVALNDKQYTLGIMRDMTESQKTEQTQRESEAWVKDIFNAIQTGVVVIDVETRTVVEANPVAVKMLGMAKKDIIGNRCYQYFHSGADNHCPILDSGLNTDNSERILINEKGERIPILKNVVRATMNGREYLVESFVDLTERKNAEAALYRANVGLEARVSQSSEISKALISDIGIERAIGIIYESGWKVGLEEARPLRASRKGSAKSFVEGFLQRHATAISLQATLTEFNADRHHARVGLFSVDRVYHSNGGDADAEMAYAQGFIAAVLSTAFGKPVGVKAVSATQGKLAPRYEIETRELEPYEESARKLV